LEAILNLGGPICSNKWLLCFFFFFGLVFLIPSIGLGVVEYWPAQKEGVKWVPKPTLTWHKKNSIHATSYLEVDDVQGLTLPHSLLAHVVSTQSLNWRSPNLFNISKLLVLCSFIMLLVVFVDFSHAQWLVNYASLLLNPIHSYQCLRKYTIRHLQCMRQFADLKGATSARDPSFCFLQSIILPIHWHACQCSQLKISYVA